MNIPRSPVVTPTGYAPDNHTLPLLGFPQERIFRSPLDNYNIYTCVVGGYRFFVWPTVHEGNTKWVVDIIDRGLDSDGVGELQEYFRVAPTHALVEFSPLVVQAVIHELSKTGGRLSEIGETTSLLSANACYTLVRDEQGHLSIPRDRRSRARKLPMVAPFVMYNIELRHPVERGQFGVTVIDKERQ